MFTNLFDEEQDLLTPAEYNHHLHGRSCASKLDLPPLPRQESQFVGLKNQYPFFVISRAATCYLNSLIQVLYMTPDFRSLIFTLPICVSAFNEFLG
jgi:ubiquitin carboxyl-terminal hydrolase 40